jgi:hypothetical protein
MLRLAPDGTKLKEKETKGGLTYEKYGHLSDTLDYVIVQIFINEFNRNKLGGKEINFILGKEPFKGATNF